MPTHRDIPRRTTARRTVAAIAMAALLALATGGAALGSEHDQGPSALFVFAGDLAGNGEFTGFAAVPGGSVSNVELHPEPPIISGIWLYDPGEPGGDTFEVHESGPAGQMFADGTFAYTLEWEIKNGTGEYVGLSGSGEMLGALNPEKDMGAQAYFGMVSDSP